MMTNTEHEVMAKLQLKADMFDYLCWLEQFSKPAELRDEHLCLASDGTTCWGPDYATAVRVAMEYDKGLQDSNAQLSSVSSTESKDEKSS